MNNSIQYDNNNISTNMYPSNNITIPTTTLFNQPTTLLPNGMNQIGQYTQHNQFDPTILNGTALDDDVGYNSNNLVKQDPTLIKSVAREIINGLKENNMSLYDNSSINSHKKNNNDEINDEFINESNENTSQNSSKKNKNSKTKNKVKEVVETIEDFVTDSKSTNSTKTYSDYTGWFFDECFNYKDFLILFILYFVLSQEMIIDFFAKYFSSLHPDNEGKIGVQGVIIYGLILTVLFMVIRKLFF